MPVSQATRDARAAMDAARIRMAGLWANPDRRAGMRTAETVDLLVAAEALRGTGMRTAETVDFLVRDVEIGLAAAEALPLALDVLGQRVGALERQIAQNVHANTASNNQKTTAAGLLLAGLAGILVFPASIYGCTMFCPSGPSHSSSGCGFMVTACVGAGASMLAALSGCVALACNPSASPRRRNDNANSAVANLNVGAGDVTNPNSPLPYIVTGT